MHIEIDISGHTEIFDDIPGNFTIEDLITRLKIRFYDNENLKHNMFQKISLKPLVISHKLNKSTKLNEIYKYNSNLMKGQSNENIKLYVEFSPETKRYKYNCNII